MREFVIVLRRDEQTSRLGLRIAEKPFLGAAQDRFGLVALLGADLVVLRGAVDLLGSRWAVVRNLDRAGGWQEFAAGIGLPPQHGLQEQRRMRRRHAFERSGAIGTGGPHRLDLEAEKLDRLGGIGKPIRLDWLSESIPSISSAAMLESVPSPRALSSAKFR